MTETTYDEPAGGWVTGQPLIDTELLMTTLCRFTGLPGSHDKPCEARANFQHPDVECRSLYIQADTLTSGTLQLEAFDVIPEQVRQPWTGGTQIATSHDG